MSKKLISIVTPVYNEAENLPLFYDAVSKIAKDGNFTFEVIFVDDGSSDDSISVIESLKTNKQSTVRLIELSRNFGKEIATTAGIEIAKGDAVIILDSDLQHPIDVIPDFIAEWERGTEVVIGVRTTHAHYNKIKKLGSELYYKLMNMMSETKIVPHSTDFRLLDRAVVDAFSTFTERQRITRGLIDWLGFKRGFVYFEANERLHGQPSYTLMKLTKLALNSFTSHSLFPLRFAGYLGAAFMFIFGILGVLVYIEMYILHDPMGLAISGSAMLAIVLLFAVGIILFCLGLIALYIANIHGEVINRPLYVVRRNKDL